MRNDIMTKVSQLRFLALLFVVAGCVTVNVYFPAAAAEQAADRIIRGVYGSGAAEPHQPAEGDDQSSHSGALPAAIAAVVDFLVRQASAQQPNIDISSPAINRLRAAMTARHVQLEPWYSSGAVAMDNNGLITLRAASEVPIKDRNTVNQLVAAENRDRNALYAEIARANGHPEWEADIRSTFARRWVANAPPGWFFQDSAGSWKQK
jgi:uncharacterized protein YdbL (DUF1318 family)